MSNADHRAAGQDGIDWTQPLNEEKLKRFQQKVRLMVEGPGFRLPSDSKKDGLVERTENRHGYLSPKAQAARRMAYISALRVCGVCSEAARMSGIVVGTVYNWRRDYPGFVTKEEDALDEYRDSLRMEVRRRAVEGVLKPVIYQGELQYLRDPNGALILDDDFNPIPLMERIVSDRLLEAMLKARLPEYRDKVEHLGKDGKELPPMQLVFVEADNGRPAERQQMLTVDVPGGADGAPEDPGF